MKYKNVSKAAISINDKAINLVKSNVDLIIIFLVSIVYCLFSSFLQRATLMLSSPDNALYINISQNFISGNGLVNTIRDYDIIVPPGYPLLISFILLIFGSVNAVFIFQYFLFGACSVLIYLVARKLFNLKIGAALSVVLFITCNELSFYGPVMSNTETLFVFLILLSIYLFILMWRSKKKSGYMIALSCVLAYCVLVRPLISLGYIFVLVVGLILTLKKKVEIRALIISILIPVVLMSANYLYNSKVQDDAIILENYGSSNLYIANNEYSDVEFYASTRIDDFVGNEYYVIKNMDLSFSEKNQMYNDKAKEYIYSHFGITVKRTLTKFFRLFVWYDTYFGLIFILAIIGAVVALINKKGKRTCIIFILTIIASIAMINSLGLIMIRYLVPVLSLYFVLVGGLFSIVVTIIKNYISKRTMLTEKIEQQRGIN